MSFSLPSRLLRRLNGTFAIVDPRTEPIDRFDIVSYTWGTPASEYDCGISGVTWPVTISKNKIADIKRLMERAEIKYLWVDCICIQQDNEREKAVEIARMFEYYKRAHTCHVLLDMPEIWDPQEIVDNLKFVDHVLYQMGGSALATEAGLTDVITRRLAGWAEAKWMFPATQSVVRSAAIDMGVLNCYATCISHVRSLFDNLYFSRVWTFQEMILGKNIQMWAISPQQISCIGELHTWMDLATDSKDKAQKLRNWIDHSRILKTSAVYAILRIIDEDKLSLLSLQLQVMGISSARSDIITGGPRWWYENHKGISNISSAISIMPRNCKHRVDIFRGLLGVFSGLFTAEEIERDMSGDDIEKISFNFFRQLSTKTNLAWTKLAISSGERGQWDWIPVVENYSGNMTTDCFAGVINLGRLESEGRAKAQAITSLKGTPRKFMTIRLTQNPPDTPFHFVFKGCNCGQSVKTGMFSRQPIHTYDKPQYIVKDETGKTLVQCATILGHLIDPGYDIISYRRRLLGKLRPNWHISDPSAKPLGWEDRCVSGTSWENPHPAHLRPHNRSMNFQLVDVYSCESRLSNDSTARIACEVKINCGCVIVAPFALVFEAITAVQGSSLGDTAARLDNNNRIILQDGLGLVQVGDVGKTFNVVAFGGNVNAHKLYSDSCRKTKLDKPVIDKVPWPSGRALVKEDFSHGLTDQMRDYGYVDTEGSGNLLISRNHVMDQYKIIGACIDKDIYSEKKRRAVTIR